MTEHEKLEKIADKIGYTIDREFIYNVREIIFTPEFMVMFISYCDINGIIAPSYYKIFLIDLHKNLNNPVDYLYNLIK